MLVSYNDKAQPTSDEESIAKGLATSGNTENEFDRSVRYRNRDKRANDMGNDERLLPSSAILSICSKGVNINMPSSIS